MTLKWFRLISMSILIFSMGCASQLNLREGVVAFRKLNYRDAFVRLKPEALKGHRDAQYAVGFMYYYGFGINEDRKLAVYWIRNAAAQGQPLAMEALKRLDDEYCGHFCVRQGPPPADFNRENILRN